jgi:hypothetical protein
VKGRRFTLVAAVAALVFAGLAGARPDAVTHGSINPNVGAAGVTLGMTRAQVIAKLGKPSYTNAHGYMQYGLESKNILFDVYLDVASRPPRVRLLGISGTGFCLAGGGPCLLHAGGQGKLRARYGKALKKVTLEDGEKVIWLKGTYKGCKVFTDFGEAGRPASAPILMVLVGYQSGGYC